MVGGPPMRRVAVAALLVALVAVGVLGVCGVDTVGSALSSGVEAVMQGV
jgi:hypothetical protein